MKVTDLDEPRRRALAVKCREHADLADTVYEFVDEMFGPGPGPVRIGQDDIAYWSRQLHLLADHLDAGTVMK